MELTEQELDTIQRTLYGLRQDIEELKYKVQQLDYYKANDSHSHPEYENR